VEKRNFLPLPELELRPLGRPARSRSYTDCAIPDLNVHKIYNELNRVFFLCGGGIKYLHIPASHRRRRRGNPVPGDIIGGHTETWYSKLGVGR
jgi:hypothetical protein